MHEQFLELCAAASIGEAAPEELVLLEQHLRECASCQQSYSDFTNIAAQQYADNFNARATSQEDEVQLPDPDLLRYGFVARSATLGIALSPTIQHGESAQSPPTVTAPSVVAVDQPIWKQLRAVAALAAVALGIFCAYSVGRHSSGAVLPSAEPSPARPTAATAAVPAAQLITLNATLEQEISRLKKDLTMARVEASDTQAALGSLSEEKQNLLAQQNSQDVAIDEMQRQLNETEAAFKAAREEIAKLQSAAGDARAMSVADQLQIRELTEQLTQKVADLNRDRELLERDRDIRDLMVARNLHIFDVFDTDTKGKTSPAFGRIFYTEGKSLVFYAYDLNDVRVHDAAYHYRVWGAKEGQDDKATSLGIFYSDDKAQRRWVFKCDDPRILRQIDSVFVTLEPSGGDPSHPKGQKLLDAYLKGLPNHP